MSGVPLGGSIAAILAQFIVPLHDDWGWRFMFLLAIIPLLIGLPLAVAAIVGGHLLEQGSLGSLFQGAAALIVFGGTLGAVLLSHSLREVKDAVRSLRYVFIDDLQPATQVLDAIGRLAIKARKDGILSLEDEIGAGEQWFGYLGYACRADLPAAPSTDVPDAVWLRPSHLMVIEHELDGHFLDLTGVPVPVKSRDTRSTGYPWT